jgi:hypothetical protein
MDKELLLEDYLNSLLVLKGVRKAYLIQNHYPDTHFVEKRINKIKLAYKDSLLVTQKGNYFFVSTRKFDMNEIDTNAKIAALLRYNCDVPFDELDRTKDTVEYNFVVKLNNSALNSINLLTYVCQTDSKVKQANSLLQHITAVFKKEELNITTTLNVVHRSPPDQLILKLLNPSHNFTKQEVEDIENVVYNVIGPSGTDELVNAINFTNLTHRGIILSIITEHKNDILSPFYPLQNYGADITQKIETLSKSRLLLLKNILVRSNTKKRTRRRRYFGKTPAVVHLDQSANKR